MLMVGHVQSLAGRLDGWLTRHRLTLGVLVSIALALLLALLNVNSGPLSNLNDIGAWRNRAMYIAMTAAVHAGVLMLAVATSRGRFSQLLLRELILTAGVFIMQKAINQKTYLYVREMLPLLRAMDAGGLGVLADWQTNLSAPMATLLYLVTRGPVYDMYLLKLLSTGCYLATCVLLIRAADRAGMGLRAQVLLTLCMILPQGFMNAACSAAPDVAALFVLSVSLTLACGMDRPRPLAAALLYGAAAALSGAALYALPVYLMLVSSGRMKAKQLVLAPAVMAAMCLPALAAGVPAAEALGSLFRANLGVPAYAGGSPGILGLIARPLGEETPQYAAMLRFLPELDFYANAQQDYTPSHYVVLMRGVTLCGIACYLGVCALLGRRRRDFIRPFALVLVALMVSPGVTAGAWLALDLLSLWALVHEPKLRAPACLSLFATAGASCLPMTEESVLPLAVASILCLTALLMLLEVVPSRREETAHG